MSKAVKITLVYGDFRRFDLVRFQSVGEDATVVKKRHKHHCYTYTVKKIKWSKYRLIRLLQRLFIIIKYR